MKFDIDERLAQRINLAEFENEIELKCWDKLANLSWRPFKEAREFARGLGLKGQAEWAEYSKGHLPLLGTRPPDIPAAPHLTYAEEGWAGLGDWLGTGTLATRLRKYRSFQKARAFARKLNLKNSTEWKVFCKGEMPYLGQLPADIPTSPFGTYKNKGWAGFGDWLGTGNIAPSQREILPFSEARAFARGLNLRSLYEWKNYCATNPREDLPIYANEAYANKGWIGWGDWLGTEELCRRLLKYRSFDLARKFARDLHLKNQREWREFCDGKLENKGSLPADIPTYPATTYSGYGWSGWGDWLGNGNVASQLREYLPFKKAQSFVISLNLKSASEWHKYCQDQIVKKKFLQLGIPANPKQTYAKDGWKGFSDWLGTGTIATNSRTYRSFREAKEFARSLMLKGQSEWIDFCKGDLDHIESLPPDIPACPSRTYKNKGWAGYGDWLGTGNIAYFLRQYRSFSEARAFARELKLKSCKEWRTYCKGEMPHLGKLPVDIPSKPDNTYANKGWMGYGDWLGNARTRVAKSPKPKS